MIGLIVDGEGDYAAFRARYRGRVRVLKADGPRGHRVTVRSIVESAKRQINILKAWGCVHVAIITDYEARSGRVDDFYRQYEEVVRIFPYAAGVKIFVADRMIENWYLADISHLSSKKKYLRNVRRQKCYESTDGKEELKKLFISGFDYNEIRHGADLFPLIRIPEASRYSWSLERFFKSELGLD